MHLQLTTLYGKSAANAIRIIGLMTMIAAMPAVLIDAGKRNWTALVICDSSPDLSLNGMREDSRLDLELEHRPYEIRPSKTRQRETRRIYRPTGHAFAFPQHAADPRPWRSSWIGGQGTSP